ncbi:MAG TPA: serpin family protein [Verrucomicrobiae bacterium]|jgi:serpin B
MKTKLLCLLLLTSGMSATMAEGAKVAAADNVFAFKLLKQIAQEEPAKNIFISPYSAAAVLQMAANGAAGSTKTEMQAALGTTKLTDGDVNAGNREIIHDLNADNTNVVLNTANAIWVQKGFLVKPDFIATNQSFFDATIGDLDFTSQQSVEVINQWASEKTHGKIPSFLSQPPGEAMRLLLANAVYFKGKWADPFEAKDTHDEPFYLRDGSQKTVPLMRKTKTFTYRRGTGYQAVRLPYQDENLAMYVFLPDTNSSPEKLLAIMSGDTWQRITKPGFNEKKGTLELPRFKLDYSVILNQSLQALGMKLAFGPGKADFSGIASSMAQLYISKVLQKTFVEVKEEGTEAAAVTGIFALSAGIEMPPTDPFTMIVNRPFLFLIEDNKTGAILFMGVMFNP